MKHTIQHLPHDARQPNEQFTRAALLRRWHGCASAALLTTTLALTACGGGDHDEGPRIDTQAAQSTVDQFRISSARPAMWAAIASNDRVLWTGVSGYADVSAKRSPSESTPAFTGSVGKLVTVAAAMQLVESGKLSLDADISPVLGYKVENPAFPGQRITMRHLLAHVSGLQDEGFLAIPKALVEFPNRDPDVKLQDFCRALLSADGVFYSADTFAPIAPETAKIYSNVGYAVAGCVIEAAAKEDFAKLTQRTIFQPLGMTRTSWRLADFKLSDLAVRYADDGQPLPTVSYADYPNGGLFSTPRDIAVFMKAMLAGGGGILTIPSVTEMLRTQYPALADGSADTGLGWQSFASPEGDILYGHAGADPGTSTFAGMNPKTQTAAVVFSNRNFLTEQDFSDYLSMALTLVKIGGKR
jgi:CubicO group peptidase (beta-lactamase class C family)